MIIFGTNISTWNGRGGLHYYRPTNENLSKRRDLLFSSTVIVGNNHLERKEKEKGRIFPSSFLFSIYFREEPSVPFDHLLESSLPAVTVTRWRKDKGLFFSGTAIHISHNTECQTSTAHICLCTEFCSLVTLNPPLSSWGYSSPCAQASTFPSQPDLALDGYSFPLWFFFFSQKASSIFKRISGGNQQTRTPFFYYFPSILFFFSGDAGRPMDSLPFSTLLAPY